MKAFNVRELTGKQYEALQAGLRSSSAFTVRRCPMVLMSPEESLKPAEIAHRLHCSDQRLRDASTRLRTKDCLVCKPNRVRVIDSQQATFDAAGRGWLKSVIRRSPRSFGFENSLGRWRC
jgi:hypothetical protein